MRVLHVFQLRANNCDERARGEKSNELKAILFGFGLFLQCTDDFGLIEFSGPMAFE
jgi:hypothetical protein